MDDCGFEKKVVINDTEVVCIFKYSRFIDNANVMYKFDIDLFYSDFVFLKSFVLILDCFYDEKLDDYEFVINLDEHSYTIENDYAEQKEKFINAFINDFSEDDNKENYLVASVIFMLFSDFYYKCIQMYNHYLVSPL